MDTTAVQLFGKLENIQSAHNTFKDSIPLLTGIIGSLVTLVGLFINNALASSRERRKMIIDIISEAESQRFNIIQAVKSRNYFAINAASFYRAHILMTNSYESTSESLNEAKKDRDASLIEDLSEALKEEDELSEHFYKKHEEYYSKQWDLYHTAQAKIGDYIKLISKYTTEKKSDNIIRENLEIIYSFKYPKEPEFLNIENVSDLTAAEDLEIVNVDAFCEALFGAISKINAQLKP